MKSLEPKAPQKFATVLSDTFFASPLSTHTMVAFNNLLNQERLCTDLGCPIFKDYISALIGRLVDQKTLEKMGAMKQSQTTEAKGVV